MPNLTRTEVLNMLEKQRQELRQESARAIQLAKQEMKQELDQYKKDENLRVRGIIQQTLGDPVALRTYFEENIFI